jgi:D-alanyl-D-alanine carboxypeptidase
MGLAIDVVDQDWYNSYSSQVLDASYGDHPGAKWIAVFGHSIAAD